MIIITIVVNIAVVIIDLADTINITPRRRLASPPGGAAKVYYVY